jgi:hypothetical protein
MRRGALVYSRVGVRFKIRKATKKKMIRKIEHL